MPSPLVKKFADETGKSVSEVEKLWKKAKEVVEKEYPDVDKEDNRFYALVVGVLKNMLKLEENTIMRIRRKLYEESAPRAVMRTGSDAIIEIRREFLEGKGFLEITTDDREDITAVLLDFREVDYLIKSLKDSMRS